MSKFYDERSCRRKSDQHWDMAGLARQDMDAADAQRHTELARLWARRAAEGGWEAAPQETT